VSEAEIAAIIAKKATQFSGLACFWTHSVVEWVVLRFATGTRDAANFRAVLFARLVNESVVAVEEMGDRISIQTGSSHDSVSPDTYTLLPAP
jgi:hypothetical protein